MTGRDLACPASAVVITAVCVTPVNNPYWSFGESAIRRTKHMLPVKTGCGNMYAF